MMLWLRLEIFQHGILHLSSQYSKCLTVQNLFSIIKHLKQQNPSLPTDSISITTSISYKQWESAAKQIFKWHPVEYKTFWDVVLFFHQMHKQRLKQRGEDRMDIDESGDTPEKDITIPLHELVLFLYAHTDKPGRKTKERLDAYNAVWLLDSPQPPFSDSGAGLPTCSSEQQVHTIAPSSPLKIGMEERKVADIHHLHYVKDHLDELLSLVFPSPGETDSTTERYISMQHINDLGFLIAGSPTQNPLIEVQALSTLFPATDDSNISISDLSKWLRDNLITNEQLYPQLNSESIALAPPSVPDCLSPDDISALELKNHDHVLLQRQRPLVINGVCKSTVIKAQPIDFPTEGPDFDIIISSCHDAYIYLLTSCRFVNIIACTNCTIVLGPAVATVTMDLCERVRLSSLCELLHISNSVDSICSVYTPRSPILTGDNRGIQFGPYNSTYPTLKQHLQEAGYSTLQENGGEYANYTNVNVDEEGDSEGGEGVAAEKEAVSLVSASAYREISVPILKRHAGIFATISEQDLILPLPRDFIEALHLDFERIQGIRERIRSEAEGDGEKEKLIEEFLQKHFREWLLSSGNLRQITDLIHFDQQQEA